MLSSSEIYDAENLAKAELRDEEFRALVEARKVAIREAKGRPWWARIFPFRITIQRI